MRINELANLLSIAPKDAITEVEGLRDKLTAQGFKIAKKLTASSGIDEDAARILMVELDHRRQESQRARDAEEVARRREEEDKRRAEEAAKRAREEDERRKAAEEARKKADAELERRQQQMARLAALAVPPPAPPPPASVAPPTAAAPQSAAAAPPVPPPVVVAPPAPPPAPVVAEVPAAPPPVAPPASIATTTGAVPPPPPVSERGPGGPPRERYDRPQSGPGGPPRYDRSGPPRNDGRPSGPGGGRFDRPSGPGGPPRSGPGGPRPSGPGGGRFDRPSGPGGPRRDGPGGPPRTGPGGPRRDGPGGGPRTGPARQESLERFAEQGLGPNLGNEARPRRRPDERPSNPRAKGSAEDEEKRRAANRAKAGADKGRKSVAPTQIFRGEELQRRSAPRTDKPRRKGSGGGHGSADRQPQLPKVINLVGDLTVGEFADRCKLPVADVMKKLFEMGEMKTINQLLDSDLAELIATELGIEVNVMPEGDEFDVEEFAVPASDPEKMRPRPPVVTVMGHVDHGKTTLLDRIRNANVVDDEFGGITQHIGAYYVTTEKGPIVFLDTPGHEAFTAMRARGAGCTDVVVLVVAANDGVMPQTVEAINHAKAANVPMIVAINKMDVPGANPLRVKQELMRYEIVSEDLGGETIMVEISAKQGTNVQSLLEMIALQAEVLELKADPDRPAVGVIVESHIDPLRGAEATVLVEEGTLRLGDVFVCGTEYGRVRAMRDDRGRALEEAGPATPVEILGLSGSPDAGEQFLVLPSESVAREIAEKRQARRKARAVIAKPHVTLDNLRERLEAGEVKSLNLIVKADVQGSVEAINASLMKIESDKILLRILHSGAGNVSEGDIQLADASDAIVLGFNVRPDPSTKELAERLGVQIKLYNIIYDLLEEIKAAMLGMVEIEHEEVETGRAVIQQIYKVSKVGTIAGCLVQQGTVGATNKARLVRNGAVVWTGKLKSLRRVKDDAKEVLAGVECGIGLENFNDIKEGDIIETFVLKELAATLVSTPKEPKQQQ